MFGLGAGNQSRSLDCFANGLTELSRRSARHPNWVTLILITGALVWWVASFALSSRAATARGSASLALRVEPAANITTAQAILGENGALVRIDLAVRVNPGTTASLWLYPASGEPPTLLLTVSHNGRYSVTTTVPSGAGSASSSKTRLELRSSDQALSISKAF